MIPSNMTMRLDKGATLLGSSLPEDYPLVEPLPGYGTTRDCCCNDWLRYNCTVPLNNRHRALLTTMKGAENIAVEGAGTIDGNGWPWWMRFETFGLDAGRPHLFEPMFAKNIRVEGIGGQLWVKDGAFWMLHLYACNGVTIRNVKITADTAHGHNTDGIDPDSSGDVLVEGCFVKVGDDAVAIKSGIDFAGRHFGVPSENMMFRNNHFANRHIAIGSEESGGVRNVTFLNNILGEDGVSSSAGIHIKAERGRGGYIRDVTFNGLEILGEVSTPLEVSMHYTDDRNKTNATATPTFSDITIQNVVINGAVDKEGWAGNFVGLPEAKMTGLRLGNVTVRLAHRKQSAKAPWTCVDVAGGAVDVVPPIQESCFATSSDQALTV